MGRYITVGGGWHPGIRLEHMSYIYIICMTCIYISAGKVLLICCWFMGCLRMVLFLLCFCGFWRFVKWILATQSEPSTGRQSISQRSRCAELICWKTHSVIQCFGWEKKDPGARFLQANGNMKDSTKNTWHCSTFDTILLKDSIFFQLFLQTPSDFPFLSCRQVGGWLTNSTCESDAMPSHPYRIASEWSGTWKSHHPTDSWDHCIFSSSILLRTGGRLFH